MLVMQKLFTWKCPCKVLWEKKKKGDLPLASFGGRYKILPDQLILVL